MAVQVRSEEIEGLKSYFVWLLDKVDRNNYAVDSEVSKEMKDILCSEVSRELCRVLFETDFTWAGIDDSGVKWEIKEDEIRAKDALEVRKRYAADIGSACNLSAKHIDRIWKSIHGKASVFEVIISLCEHLDQMVNEDGEPGDMVGMFFRILVHNLRLDEFDDEDFDHRKDDVLGIWNGRIKTFLNRDYFESGCCGGLFPLEKWHSENGKDQKKLSLWYQMNAWLDEHLDENCEFVV